MILHFVECNETEKGCHDSVIWSVMIFELTTTPGNAVEKLPVTSQTHPLSIFNTFSRPYYFTLMFWINVIVFVS